MDYSPCGQKESDTTERLTLSLSLCKLYKQRRASLVAWLIKNPPAMWETWVRSLGWEDPLEKETCHSLHYSGLENPIACIVYGVAKESDTSERLNHHHKHRKHTTLTHDVPAIQGAL